MSTADPNQQAPAWSDQTLRLENIQGNILAPFNKPHQTFLFLNFRNDQDGARRWLASLLAGKCIATTQEVAVHNAEFKATSPEGEAPKAIWIGVSLTSSGLVTLHEELASDLVAYEAFWQGPFGGRRDEQGYPRAIPPLLDGTQASDPVNWVIGAPRQEVVDALVTIAADDGDEEKLSKKVETERDRARHLNVLFEQQGNKLSDGKDHFGFKEGVSQPGIVGFTKVGFTKAKNDNRLELEDKEHPGSPIIATGEFVLGYPGEPRSYLRGRPPNSPAWMRDGSFHVFLRLTQDVACWHGVMNYLSGKLGVDAAAKVIGREIDGTPLAPGADPDRPNDFDYHDDAHGYYTPRFAHIRKVNPRDDERFRDRTHRLLRRGIPFGKPFEPGERGLLFNAFMASIEDQFEFVLRNWAGDPVFPAEQLDASNSEKVTGDGPDPLIVTNPADCLLRTPQDAVYEFKLKLPVFVRTTGAVYGFAPSIKTLGRLALSEPLRDE